eukprot:m51a1_g12825 hypothetical protein (377) ;mRNA; r:132-2459
MAVEIRVCIVSAQNTVSLQTMWTASPKLHGWSDGQHTIAVTSVKSIDELSSLSSPPNVIALPDPHGTCMPISTSDAKRLEAYITANRCCLYGSYSVFNKAIMPLFGLRKLEERLDETPCSGEYLALTKEGKDILGGDEFASRGYNWAQTWAGRRWVEDGAVPCDLTTDNSVVALAAERDGKAALLFYRGAQHRALWWTSFPESGNRGREDCDVIARSIVYLAVTSAGDEASRAAVDGGGALHKKVVHVVVIGSRWAECWKAMNLGGFRDSSGTTIALEYYESIRHVDRDASVDVFVLPNISGSGKKWSSEEISALQELTAKNRAGILATYCTFLRPNSLMLYEGPKYRALWWTSFPEWSGGRQDKEVFARALFFLR